MYRDAFKGPQTASQGSKSPRVRRPGRPQHLVSAADALRAVLARRDPEHSFAVRVREGDRDDSAGPADASRRKPKFDAASEDSSSIGDRNPMTSPVRSNDDSREQAA
jgi:hypothetical protein